ncbi:hypothetical protein ZWY2020_005537 [Hordeum vulgare]|nr:hypothetical protein ZWY2020_005537 [Hordeum vulgare]
MAATAMRALALAAFLFLAASGVGALPRFAEAPEYRNGEGCQAAVAGAGCATRAAPGALAASFPALRFEIYPVRADAVTGLISASVRAALEAPLNYARNYLADLLPTCVPRAIYLDSDVLAVDDVRRLWATRLPAAAVVAAPEYCHANFSRYFTDAFWSDPDLGPRVFAGRRRAPCYFNTGVMVIDLRRWRSRNYRHRIEQWMELQEKRIYELGSLPLLAPLRRRGGGRRPPLEPARQAATTCSAAAARSTRALSA